MSGLVAPQNVADLHAMYRLGLIDDSRLKSVALDLLVEPVDDELLELTLCADHDDRGIRRAIGKLFDRPEFTSLTSADHLRRYAGLVSSLTVAGDLSPRDAAELIGLANIESPKDFHDLDTFSYAWSEFDGRPDDQAMFEKAIMEEAALWSARRRAQAA